MGPGEIDVQIIRRHMAALRESLQVLAARSGVSVEEPDADTELLWVVERGVDRRGLRGLLIPPLPLRRLGPSRGHTHPGITHLGDAGLHYLSYLFFVSLFSQGSGDGLQRLKP